MKNLLLTTAIMFSFAAPAFASETQGSGHAEVKTEDHGSEQTEDGHGDDEDGHGNEHAEMMIGVPGNAANVDRTIDVTMRETDGGEMLFFPTKLEITKGETIRFNVVNNGELEHEFVIDTLEENQEHKEMMAEMDMEHDDPNSIRLDEGGSGEVIWTFTNEGTFEFACLIPGHYESGMHGPITVALEIAQAEAPYSKGKIKKIDAKNGKVTVAHGPLVNLDMPAMTMVFRADEAMIAKMSEGQDIEFVEERVKGKLTIVKMK